MGFKEFSGNTELPLGSSDASLYIMKGKTGKRLAVFTVPFDEEEEFVSTMASDEVRQKYCEKFGVNEVYLIKYTRCF